MKWIKVNSEDWNLLRHTGIKCGRGGTKLAANQAQSFMKLAMLDYTD